MPNVEVPGLTLVPGDHGDWHGHHDNAILYAASHGLGAWKLDLERGHEASISSWGPPPGGPARP